MRPTEPRTHFEAQAQVLVAELDWLEAAMHARFTAYGNSDTGTASTGAIPPPPPINARVPGYASLVCKHELAAADRLILILALAPHLAPGKLDAFLLENQATGRRFTEFGGIVGKAHSGFLPTVESALFMLAAGDLGERLYQMQRLTSEHVLVRCGILSLVQPQTQEPATAAVLQVTAEGLHQLVQSE